MAQLDVQPKKSSPWWLWLLLLIILIALVLFLVKGCGSHSDSPGTADSAKTAGDTTGKQPVAVTKPNWDSVDFNAPQSSDPGISDKDITVSGNDRYTIYTLGENILFATDQDSLQDSAADKLKMIAAAIKKRYNGASIGVYGNTDSTGTAGHNKQLGTDRASAVRSWLIKTGGVDPETVSVHSLGEAKPVASNSTAGGRQQNRNVEIVAIPNAAN